MECFGGPRESMNLLGITAMVRRRLLAYAAAGITTLGVEPAGETLDERLATLGRPLDLARELRAAVACAPVAALAAAN
jgi:hypothetical protein